MSLKFGYILARVAVWATENETQALIEDFAVFSDKLAEQETAARRATGPPFSSEYPVSDVQRLWPADADNTDACTSWCGGDSSNGVVQARASHVSQGNTPSS